MIYFCQEKTLCKLNVCIKYMEQYTKMLTNYGCENMSNLNILLIYIS